MIAETITKGLVSASLWRGDALDFLKSLPSASVDLILSSPPYCVGKEYDKYSTVSEFQSEISRISDEIIRVLKSGGNLCWQVGHHVSNGVVCPLDAIIYGLYMKHEDLILRNRIIWHFEHGAHAKLRFSGRHETVLWYSKGSDIYFNLDAVRTPQKYPGKRHYKGPNKGELSGNPLGKNPSDVWAIPNVKARHIEKTEHPCQFPVALGTRLISALCPPQGIVIDPYMGSGTTGVAALVLDRNFLGADLEDRYLDIAKDRLGDAANGKATAREDKPARAPNPREAVSRRPTHFLS